MFACRFWVLLQPEVETGDYCLVFKAFFVFFFQISVATTEISVHRSKKMTITWSSRVQYVFEESSFQMNEAKNIKHVSDSCIEMSNHLKSKKPHEESIRLRNSLVWNLATKQNTEETNKIVPSNKWWCYFILWFGFSLAKWCFIFCFVVLALHFVQKVQAIYAQA